MDNADVVDLLMECREFVRTLRATGKRPAGAVELQVKIEAAVQDLSSQP